MVYIYSISLILLALILIYFLVCEEAKEFVKFLILILFSLWLTLLIFVLICTYI